MYNQRKKEVGPMEQEVSRVYDEIYRLAVDTWWYDNPIVKELALKYNSKVSDEAKRIHSDSIIIDNCSFGLENDNWHIAESGLTAVNCTVTAPTDNIEGAVRNFMLYHSVLAASKQCILINTTEDIFKAKKEGKTGIILGSQNCEFVLNDDIDSAVEVFSKIGLRIMQIAYNQRSFAAEGCYTGDDAGLTIDGKKLIRAMERHGVQVDLSHVGMRSTLEAMEICDKPPIFSHSNPKKLFDHVRNITDEQAKKCAEKGGVIGVSAYSGILWNKRNFPNINDFLDAIVYYSELIGTEHVGIGMDSNAQAGTYIRREQYEIVEMLKEREGKNSLYYQSVVNNRGILTMFTEGLLNIANMICITDGLLKRGFNEKEIKQIMGMNWLRVFEQGWSKNL